MRKSWSSIFGIILSLALGTSLAHDLSAGTTDVATPNTQTQGLPLKSGRQLLAQQTYPTPNEAAQNALEILKSPGFFREETGGIERARKLGFQSLAEVADATFGMPLPVIDVELKQLKDFRPPNDDPNSLLVDPHTIIFPLYVNADVRSSLTVSDHSKKNRWLRTQRGSPILIRRIEELRKKLGQSGNTFIVANRGIGLRFLGRRTGDKLTLTPIETFVFGTVELKAGEELPAREVFIKLAPIAEKLFEMYTNRKGGTGKATQSILTH